MTVIQLKELLAQVEDDAEIYLLRADESPVYDSSRIKDGFIITASVENKDLNGVYLQEL